MNRLEDRLTDAAAAVRQAAARAVPPPLEAPSRRPRGWLALALAGAAAAVALVVVGLLTLTGPGDETVRVADTATTPTTAPTTAPPATTAPTTTAAPTTAPPATTAPTTAVEAPPATTAPTSAPTTAPPATTVPTTAVEAPPCSAAGAPVPTPQDGLPAPVAALRDQIGAAAVACDLATLESLAGPDLVTSFGGGGPERFAESEASGEGLLDILARILDTPYAVQSFDDGSQMYVWPSAFAYPTWQEIPQADLDALLDVYTQAELDELAAFGSYAGWRVGITEDGDWRFFVAGD